MKVISDEGSLVLQLENIAEVKSFKRLLRHADEDFKNFPHLHMSSQLSADYLFLKELKKEIT